MPRKPINKKQNKKVILKSKVVSAKNYSKKTILKEPGVNYSAFVSIDSIKIIDESWDFKNKK